MAYIETSAYKASNIEEAFKIMVDRKIIFFIFKKSLKFI